MKMAEEKYIKENKNSKQEKINEEKEEGKTKDKES